MMNPGNLVPRTQHGEFMPFADPDARKRYHKDYYEQNKHKGWNKHLKSETSERREERLLAMRSYMLRRSFGLTPEQYSQMLKEQDSKCALCDETPKAKAGRHAKTAALAVDHCHKTGKVRRLLCSSCNMKLGWYESNKSQIEEYLNGKR